MKKKILIGLALVLVALAGGLFLFVRLASESLPRGQEGRLAEELTDKMFDAVGKEAWDSTAFAMWSFRGTHHYVWNKTENFVRIQWDQNTVYLYPAVKTGRAFVEQSEQSGTSKEELIQTAWDYFNNDSFWVIAPLKARDPGTTRKLVETPNSEALLVTYSSGGTTPGDSYLWILDESGLPSSWKMWVQIIPIGGLEFTWENYTATRTGVQVALEHKAEGFSVPISGVDFAMDLKTLNVSDSLLIH